MLSKGRMEQHLHGDFFSRCGQRFLQFKDSPVGFAELRMNSPTCPLVQNAANRKSSLAKVGRCRFHFQFSSFHLIAQQDAETGHHEVPVCRTSRSFCGQSIVGQYFQANRSDLVEIRAEANGIGFRIGIRSLGDDRLVRQCLQGLRPWLAVYRG